jgi:acyl dehydratase
MTHGTIEVSGNRFRETFGRSYEDFHVGDVYEHRPGRTVTETDNTWFTLLTMNNHPLHFDTEYAAKSEFKKPIVNSCLTLSIVVGMSVSDVSYKAIGNLGWNDIRLTAPVFAGDTLYADSEVLSKRESKSRPTQGIVTVMTRGLNQHGTTVISFERTVLVPKRGHGVEDVVTD